MTDGRTDRQKSSYLTLDIHSRNFLPTLNAIYASVKHVNSKYFYFGNVHGYLVR